MPRSRAEAMMCGTPIVTTPYYDISEYIVHGENGFIAENHYDMIEFSNKIIGDSALFESLCKSSRKSAIEFFGLKRYLDDWIELINA